MVDGPVVDQGYAWVIALCGFCLQGLSNGMVYIMGIYIPDWLDTFGENRTKTALTVSLSISVLSFAAPLVSILINRFGHRSVAVIGGVLAGFGYLATAFAPNIYVIYVTFGIFAAFGMCMYYLASLVIVPFYFVKRKVLVMGLASVGGGVFALIMPLVLTYFIQVFSWRGSIILQGGIILHACILGALLRPPPHPLQANNKRNRSYKETLLNVSLLKEIKFWLFFFSSLMWSFSFILMAFGPDFALECGYSKQEGAILLSVAGVISALCRLLTALLAGCPRCHRPIIYTFGVTIRCLPVPLLPLVHNYFYLVGLFFMFGAGFGVQIALYAVVTEQFFGSRRFASAYGYNFFAIGVAAVLGPPFVGYLHDISGSYNLAFYLVGGLSLMSPIMLAIVVIIDYQDKKSTVLTNDIELYKTKNELTK